MNWINMLLGVIIAGAAGYLLEPDLRHSLTGEYPGKKKALVKVDTPAVKSEDPAVAVTDPAPVVADPIPEVKPEPKPEPVPMPEPVPTEPAVEIAPAPEPKPADPKPEEPKPAEPKPEEAKPEEPKAEETKSEELSITGKLTDEQVVKAMQSSFHSGDFKEFSLDKASAWKAGPLQKIDGEVYQTGMVDYASETIFGMKVVQAKALIQDGRVVKWVSSKSGMEIK